MKVEASTTSPNARSPPPPLCTLAASWLPADLAASRLAAAVLYKLDRDEYVRSRDEYYEAQPEGWQAAVPRLQAVVRSKLVRNNIYPFVPDDRSPPSPQTSSLRRSRITSTSPSPTSSTASAAPTASPGSPASPTLLPSPCAIFASPPFPSNLDAASAATLCARACYHQPTSTPRLPGCGGRPHCVHKGCAHEDRRLQHFVGLRTCCTRENRRHSNSCVAILPTCGSGFSF